MPSVLVTRINQLRDLGLVRLDAIIEAGSARLRPIIMTTLTTTLGLLPLALGLGEGAEMRTPMAITVIGGLLFATLLTLVVIRWSTAWWTGEKRRPTASDLVPTGRPFGQCPGQPDMTPTRIAIRRPVTTLMVSISLMPARGRRIAAAAAGICFPDVGLSRHDGAHSLSRQFAGRSGAPDYAPG